jgi:hypothetical protein
MFLLTIRERGLRYGGMLLLVMAVGVPLSAATITVTDTGDAIQTDGLTTLREAIVSINDGADVNGDVSVSRSGVYGSDDAIHFLIGAGPQTITVRYALPMITASVILDGGTQPGFEDVPIITIDGSLAPGVNGLVISSLTSTVVQHLVVQNFGGNGILVVEQGVNATPPVANPQSVTTGMNAPVAVTLTASDPDDTTFTFAITAAPSHGTISGFNAATGALTYTPATGYTGDDAFSFTASDSANTSAPATVSIMVLDAPGGLVAAAVTSTRVDLSWIAYTGATSYQVDRRSAGGTFVQIGTSATNAFSDTAAAPDTAYQYRVRAVISGGTSSSSTPDLATTVIFTDSPLSTGVVVKAIHLGQLRTAVNAVRALAALSPAGFTDSASPGVPIRAVHFSELRTALDAARTSLGMAPGSYTDPSLAGQIIRAVHVQELRSGVQ